MSCTDVWIVKSTNSVGLQEDDVEEETERLCVGKLARENIRSIRPGIHRTLPGGAPALFNISNITSLQE